MFTCGEYLYEGSPSLEGGEFSEAILKAQERPIVSYAEIQGDRRLARQIEDIKNTQALLQQRQEAVNKLKIGE